MIKYLYSPIIVCVSFETWETIATVTQRKSWVYKIKQQVYDPYCVAKILPHFVVILSISDRWSTIVAMKLDGTSADGSQTDNISVLNIFNLIVMLGKVFAALSYFPQIVVISEAIQSNLLLFTNCEH